MHAALAHLPRLLLLAAAIAAVATLLQAPDKTPSLRPADAPHARPATQQPTARPVTRAQDATPVARAFARAYAAYLLDPSDARARRAVARYAASELARAFTSSGARPLPGTAPIRLETLTQAHAPAASTVVVFVASYRRRGAPITVSIETTSLRGRVRVIDVDGRVARAQARGAW